MTQRPGSASLKLRGIELITLGPSGAGSRFGVGFWDLVWDGRPQQAVGTGCQYLPPACERRPKPAAIRPPAADLFRTRQVMSTETIGEDAATDRQDRQMTTPSSLRQARGNRTEYPAARRVSACRAMEFRWKSNRAPRRGVNPRPTFRSPFSRSKSL